MIHRHSRFRSAILVQLLIFLSVVSVRGQDLSYTIEWNRSSPATLQSTFEHSTDSEGQLRLHYENAAWGLRGFFSYLQSVKTEPAAEKIEWVPDENLVRIQGKPDSPYRIHYTIQKGYSGPLLNEHRFRPTITSEYFQILGMQLFMLPEAYVVDSSQVLKIQVRWPDFEKEGVIHSSFGPGSFQRLELTREALYSSFHAGGDLRRYSFNVDGQTVYFLTRGDWSVASDDKLVQLLEEAMQAQQSFWQDSRKENYSVILYPTEEPWTETSKQYSIGGSSLTNSFYSFASNNPGTSLQRLRWLYFHELLHRWIGATIINQNEVAQYWFSEGFTDYYTYKLMLKSGTVNVSEFVELLNNEVLIPHFNDPVNHTKNSFLNMETYWGNYATYAKLPYRRGLLYAFLLDLQIKEISGMKISLDVMMKELFRRALKDEDFRFNEDVFLVLLKEMHASESNAAEEFKKYILDGDLIDFRDRLPIGLIYKFNDSGAPSFIISPEADQSALSEILSF